MSNVEFVTFFRGGGALMSSELFITSFVGPVKSNKISYIFWQGREKEERVICFFLIGSKKSLFQQ
jgi:hypothetical protein